MPAYLTDALADDAVGLLREAAGAGQPDPFVRSLSFTAPHRPWAGRHPPEAGASSRPFHQ